MFIFMSITQNLNKPNRFLSSIACNNIFCTTAPFKISHALAIEFNAT